MNVWIAIFAVIMVILMPGCSMFDSKEDIAVTPTLVTIVPEAGTESLITNTAPVSVQTTVSEPTPIVVPRVAEAQLVGVIRELRANGCIIKKVANTDGIHYSQLVVTCADAQAIPLVQ